MNLVLAMIHTSNLGTAGFIRAFIVLVIIGVVLYLIERFIPMDAVIKVIIRVLVVIFAALWLLNYFGIM